MTNLWQLLAAPPEGGRSRFAALAGDAAATWRDFERSAGALGAELQRGLRPGDRVSSLQDNTALHAELYLAAAGAGLVFNPLNVRLAPAEIAEIVRRAESRWLFVDPRLADRIELATAGDSPVERVLWTHEPSGTAPTLGVPSSVLAPPEASFEPAAVADGDVAQLYYTSGTTGTPKGVALTHGNVATHARNAVAELGLTRDDVWGHFAPMFHLADAWAVFAVTAAGGTHVYLPRFDAGAALDAIARHGVTLTNLVPTMLGDILAEQRARPRDVSSLRLLLSGGAPIAPALVGSILDVFGCDYVQTYGMTETSPYLTLSVLHEHLRALPREGQLVYKAKTGRPFLGVDLEVVGAGGAPVPPDGATVGEIRVRGASVSPGYWRDSEATAQAFRDGWLYTGDLAVLDGEGYVDIVDRAKDMILTGGENVYSIEVENVLYEQPHVREVAVVGLPHERWGEAVHAAVVLHEGSVARGEAEDEALLRNACRAKLAGYKVPLRIHRLDALPRTGSGKIHKGVLREALATR